MLAKGTQTAVVMCKYYAFKGAPNSNCNVEVPFFQSDPTTISNEQIKKNFKSTSIPKKLWVKISSKKF